MDSDTDKDIKTTEEVADEKPEEDLPADRQGIEEAGPQEKSNKNLFIIGGVIVGVIVVATAGFFLLFSRETAKEEKTAVPEETWTPSPTEAPKKTLNRADWTFEVLNGSGVSGAAKKLADQLKDLGYQVVKTGNADRDDYPKTQILINKDFLDRIDLVIADIKDVVKVASVSGELKDSTASARIILGKP